jgi:hypothetical protein
VTVSATHSPSGRPDGAAIIRARLGAQHLDEPRATTPEEVVGALLAVQAQDFEPACWSIGMRTRQADAQEVFAAFDEGRFLRTHVLRPTWHFVAPEDLRWLLTLTAPRVHVANGYMYRSHGLDAVTLNQATAAVVAALEASPSLSRAELAEALARAGVEAAGNRLAYILMHAELERVVCSGPRRGRTQTYALFDRRVREAGVLEDDEALCELAVRFFSGHGPATADDLKRWASLTVAQTKTAIATADDRLETADLDGRTYYHTAGPPEGSAGGTRVHLVKAHDEYISGFPDSRDLVDATGQASGGPRQLTADILVDGHLSGTWKRSFERQEITVELAPSGPVDGDLRAELVAAAQRYGSFHRRPVRVVVFEDER